MTEINLVIEGTKGEAVKRFAALAGKTVEQLVLSWIQDRIDHALVVSMRAGGATWEGVASELGTSITQARRIYAAGSEFQPIGKEDVRVAEKYLKALEEIKEITNEADDMFPVPSEEDLDRIEEYWKWVPSDEDKREMFPAPTQEDLAVIEEYNGLLTTFDEDPFPVPSEEDIKQIRRYKDALPENK